MPLYAHRLERVLVLVLVQPESMPGLACFVGRTAGPKFVCSAAPPAEVQAQLARLGLTPHSQRIYASHRDQAMALRDIQWQRPELRVLFFGDAPQDLAAATAAGVSFVAVVGERDAFPGQAIPKLQDFSDELLVERSMLKALCCRVALPLFAAHQPKPWRIKHLQQPTPACLATCPQTRWASG